MAKELTYETKCRRCGKIHEWAFGGSFTEPTEKDWDNLNTWVFEHFNSPSVSRCDKCKKDTLQDYVSYTRKGG